MKELTKQFPWYVPPRGAEPIFSTDLPETLGIRKFLEMSMADLREQIKHASKDSSISPKRFRQMKTHATILTVWMVSALEMVDNMLSEAKAREPVQPQ
jgi:hypothetical protein